MLVAVKAETTVGTDAFGGGDPSADDWIACYADSFIQEQRIEVRDATVRAYAAANTHDTYGSHCDVEVHIPLTGKASTAGDAPAAPVDALMQAAGFEGTENAGTSYVYNLATFHGTSNATTATVYLAEYTTAGEVRTYKATGCRFNANLAAEPDAHVRLSFVGIGKYADTDEAPVTAPTAPSAYTGGKSPLLTQGMTFSLEGNAQSVINYSLSTNWSLEEDRTVTGSTSLDTVDLIRPDGQPAGSSVDFRNSSSLDYILGEWKADSVLTLAVTFTDGTDTVAIAGEVQCQQYTKAAGNIYSYTVPLAHVATSGDDDVVITFT
jgi:hypothetical protein